MDTMIDCHNNPNKNLLHTCRVHTDTRGGGGSMMYISLHHMVDIYLFGWDLCLIITIEYLIQKHR